MRKHRSAKPLQEPSKLWLWGKHACLAALQNPQRRCLKLLITEAALKDLSLAHERLPCKTDILSSAALTQKIPEGAVHQGIAVEVAPLEGPSYSLLKRAETGILVVLDQVTDPHNVGAIFRTAKALGALGVMMTERNAPPLSGVLAKTASGALDSLPIWKVTNLSRALEELKAMDFWTVGLDERAQEPIAKVMLPPKAALVMGAEGEGLRRLTRENCDFLVRLPTDPDFPTLNVSVALAIALYEGIRERERTVS